MSFFRRRMMADVKYNVTFNLDGLTTSASTKVSPGGSYTASFTPDTGKLLIPASVKVTMGTTDVTEETYNDELNRIEIANVIGDVVINAEAATIPSTYKPVLYLYPGTTGTGGTKNRNFDSGLKATEKTTAEMDLMIWGKTTRPMMFGASNFSTSPSFCVVASNTGGATGSVYYGNKNGDVNQIVQKRFTAKMSPEGYRYMNSSGNYATKSYTNTLTTFTTSRNIVFAGFYQSNTFRMFYGRIYRFKITEDLILMRDYIPCKRISDGFTGFYDLVNNTFLTEKTTANAERSDFFTPAVFVSRTLTNCTDAIVSTPAYNYGNYAWAVYGATWVCKYTPSSGYTFNSDEATFQVIINNEDVTSDVATYDSTTDTWTVTLVAHWGDTISVTATAIQVVQVEYIESNGTSAIATNYVPTGTNIKILTKLNVVQYNDSTAWKGIISAYTSETSNCYRIIRYSNGNTSFYCSCGSRANSGKLVSSSLNTIYEIEMTNSNIKLNDVSTALTTTQGTENTGLLYLSATQVIARFYYLQVYDNNNLVLDLIPVRVGTQAGVKDNVSGKLMFPATTWTYQDLAVQSVSNPDSINNIDDPNIIDEEEM